MKKIMVSGCYDVLHGGHVEFFRQAKALGDYLIVCVPSDSVLFQYKKRMPWIPLEHKIQVISALEPVDEVIVGGDLEPGLNFRSQFLKIKPQVLAVTEDDTFEDPKRQLCEKTGAQYVRLPKSLDYDKISTTEILDRVRAATQAPLRVDLAGGWLDVPRFSRPDGYIVNCAISPMVSLYDWSYEKCSGIGGSGAYALLQGKDGVASELENNVGWQDPVVIMETGLCVWRSGRRPVLDAKVNPDFLKGRMALLWTGTTHVTQDLADVDRDYELLVRGGQVGRAAALAMDFDKLCEAVNITHEVQLKEGMNELPCMGERAKKYCGSGHGGYAVFFFDERPRRKDLMPIEPYMERFFES
jgi:cytidyltransferase-like protein